MLEPADDIAATGPPLRVGRTGLASVLLAVFRPADARAAVLDAHGIVVESRSGSRRVAFGEIERVDVVRGWFGRSLRLGFAGGGLTVSGVAPNRAWILADRLDDARAGWWRDAFAGHRDALRSVHAGIAALADPVRYTRASAFSRLEAAAADLAGRFPGRWPGRLVRSREAAELEAVRRFVRGHDGLRDRANSLFVERELERSRAFFDGVGARPLTSEQRRSVVTDEDSNLVVAAAGSGKTSVIAAKAAWLVERGYCEPSEILLLAFARNAREEMQGRVAGLAGAVPGPEVRTFHSLGMSIIGEAEGRRPSLAAMADDPMARNDALKGIVDDLLVDPQFSGPLAIWFQRFFAPYRALSEFMQQPESWEYMRANDIRSLKGERLRSFEECEIANFLLLNGVAYEYERPYVHNTATRERRQYKPDFYLPDHGIYIEHFALSAAGDTPPFIDRDEYLRSRQWKLELHERFGTTLVETFSHERAAGRLTANLAERLRAHGVELSPIPEEKARALIDGSGRIDVLAYLVGTFLDHFKGSRLTMDEVAERAAGARDWLRAEVFVAVFAEVFRRYQGLLRERGELDFHDLITRAADHVESGRYASPYRYIMVDEFQDISSGRARLLKALLGSSPDTQLLAVGDDWQAIYRFAGSDIAIMRGFDQWFGPGARSDLGTTFRCAEETASVAARFVLRNAGQLRKEVSSTHRVGGPCVHVGFPRPDGPGLLETALAMIDEDAPPSGGQASVLVLGRYNHLRPDSLGELAEAHPRLDLDYRTVHAAKGLEADHVVVLGLTTGRYGFPSEIEDDPLLELVLPEPEGHPHAEERRLLYVAMTRARRRVFLLVDGDQASPFVRELIGGEYGVEVEVFGRPLGGDVACPECGDGRLRPRNGRDGPFFGCTNHPYCGCIRPVCPHCQEGWPQRSGEGVVCPSCGRGVEPCPRCDGWLHERAGRDGRFLGCANHPDCGYTRPACPHCQEGWPQRSGKGVVCPSCGRGVEPCPRCDGWLRERAGRRGPFLGCVNYPDCRYIRDV